MFQPFTGALLVCNLLLVLPCLSPDPMASLPCADGAGKAHLKLTERWPLLCRCLRLADRGTDRLPRGAAAGLAAELGGDRRTIANIVHPCKAQREAGARDPDLMPSSGRKRAPSSELAADLAARIAELSSMRGYDLPIARFSAELSKQ